MSSSGSGFKRMVVGLPHGSAGRAAVDAAVDLAEFLNIELLATFIADAALPALAGLSAVRELRALEEGWQAIDSAQITRDIDRAIGAARQYFAESIKGRSIKTGFDVLTDAEAIATLIRSDDIVAIIEPGHPGERITRQFTGLLEAAFEAAGAVLALPTRIARTRGPIVVIASDSQDAGIRTALDIAAALKEPLIVVTAADAALPTGLLAEAQQLGVRVELTDASLLTAGRLHERLRVLTRSALTESTTQLFSSLQGVPLLVIEAGRAGAAVDRKTGEDHQSGQQG